MIVHFALSAYDYVKEGGSKFERMDICECCKEAGGLNKRKIENEEPIDMTNCCCTFDSTDMTFYSAEADHELKNIYVFYFPNYNSRNSSDPLDDLRFYNKGGIPVTFNLTKERDEEKGIPTQSEEMGYRMNFTVKEEAGSKSGDWDSELGAYKALTKFNTNLNYDISKHEEISERETISQMNLVYEDEANGILQCNGLDDRRVSDRIYITKVKVYKKGAAERGFPEEDLIAGLDGAKED